MRQRPVASRQRKDAAGRRRMEERNVAESPAVAVNGVQDEHELNADGAMMNGEMMAVRSSWSNASASASRVETHSSELTVDQVLQLLDMVNQDFPNSQGKWIYIDRNIRSVECTVASDVPVEAWKDDDYMSVFCSNYPYGPRNREPSDRVSMSPDQIYELVETVTPLLMDMSESSLRIVESPFCRPMPPDEIFCMIATAVPSLGSAEAIKRMYYHALTDPAKSRRVYSAAVLSGREGCTATDQDWLLLLLCPMCMVFDCPEHGYGSYRRLIEKDQACSADCFLSSADKIFQRADVVLKMPRKVTGMRQKARELCKSKQYFRRALFNQWPCQFARDGGLPCSMVYLLQSHLKILGDAMASPYDWRAPVPAKLLKGTKSHTWKRLLKVVLKLRNSRKRCEDERYPYKPCFCAGKCEKSNCACALHGFCEKYCCCSDDCILRFPGCRCQTDCTNNLCPCYKANRECDVDLCLACSGMKSSAVPSSSAEMTRTDAAEMSIVEMSKFWSARCNNMQLQKGSSKTLYVSESNVHGLGVFAGEPLKRGDLVCEYTGEIVPRREADRRGVVYDYVSKSYLFTLNKEYDIDATRFGNEARFINHCSQSKCAAEIKLVNGAHRIGIYAIKDVDCGEELFFDYRYSKEDETKYPHIV